MSLHHFNTKKIENVVSGIVLIKELREKINPFLLKSVFLHRKNKTKEKFLQNETIKETFSLSSNFFNVHENILWKYNIINPFYFLNLQKSFSKRKASVSKIKIACEILKQISYCNIQKENNSTLTQLNKIFCCLIPYKHETNLSNTKTLQNIQQKVELLECLKDNLPYHTKYLKNIYLKVCETEIKSFRFRLKHLKQNSRNYKLVMKMIGRNYCREKNTSLIKVRSIFQMYK